MNEQSMEKMRAPTHSGVSNTTAAERAEENTVIYNSQPIAVERDGKTIATSKPLPMNRGMSAVIPPSRLRAIIWLTALQTLNRLRVIRAVDIALACFPERGYKAALTAAQRAMRGMSKAGLVRRYRTDRFQHVYGLTVAGAELLEEYGFAASSSVRRVADMTNPEHMLWMNFIALAAEARGLKALTESEMMKELNLEIEKKGELKQGLVTVSLPRGKRILRPDVLIQETDGATWVEIDRSARGAEREASLVASIKRIGTKLANGQRLRRVVVFARTDTILKRIRAIVRATAEASEQNVLTCDGGGRHFREVEPDVFEVWAAVLSPGTSHEIDARVGHVVLQILPTWLPKVRLDGSNRQPLSGWLNENYLPYRRPMSAEPWRCAESPLPGRSNEVD